MAYSNHFQNGFHFDDAYAVVDNVYIRSLKNIPLFFTDARTFSSLPSNQTYRPIVSTSLAIDYHVAGGLHPLWFHVSTFFWYLVQLGCMFLLFTTLLERARPEKDNTLLALFATAWYGLHPANAETVNYVMQRGDLYSTLGVVAGLMLYARYPRTRRWGLYLLPVGLGALSKPPALMFAPILLAYILLFEEPRWGAAIKRSLPAFGWCILLAAVEAPLTPNTLLTGGPLPQYLMTQTFVALYYFKCFWLPTTLSADSDFSLIENPFSDAVIGGTLFVAAMVALIWRTARDPQTRPICFGLVWFLLALAPTSLMPLAEVENDHRMFFPFAGLALAASCALELYLERTAMWQRIRRAAVPLAALFLLPYAYGTYQRNAVWHTDESLWYDVTLKSPRNGRGLMNYGITQMRRANYAVALDYFTRALAITPQYPILEINLGIVNGAIGRDAEAEQHFNRALALEPGDALPYFYYARWLREKGRIEASIRLLREAIARNPAYLDPRYLLMQIYWEQRDWGDLKSLAEQTASIAADDPTALQYLARLKDGAQR